MKLKDVDDAIAESEAEIRKHTARLVALRELRKQFVGDEQLQSTKQSSTLDGTMDNLSTSHKRNISASRTSESADSKFLAHIRDPKNDRKYHKGYTLRSLAEELRVSPSMLSLNRRTHKCPKDRADKVEELTGWPADDKHWPAKISS